MKLHDLPWPAVAGELERGTPVILPFGSIEQHGPHLPMDTDTVCVQAVADRAADAAGAISMPALSYGAPSRPRSGGGPVFPLGAEIPLGTYYDVVLGITRGLLSRGVRNLVVMTWHTENAAVLYDAVREAISTDRVEDAKIVNLDSPGNLITAATGAKIFVDGPMPAEFEHAGLLETSVMLALDPAGVHAHDHVESALPALPYDVLPQPAGAVAASGSFTSPKNATAEIGELMLGDLVPGLAGVIDREFGSRRSA